MQNDITVAGLFQSAFKCINQMMGQLADKSNRISQKDLLPTGKLQLPCGGIQSGKQFILRQNPGIRQVI